MVLEAVEQLALELKSYKFYNYSVHPIVVEKIECLKKESNLDINYSTRGEQLSHLELIKLFGKAKIAIAISKTDGIPNTLLESIIMGTFPIQTNPGGVTEEYISEGKNGFLINNNKDIESIKKAILLALNNPHLLEKAFKINQKLAEHLEANKIKKEVLNAYKSVVL